MYQFSRLQQRKMHYGCSGGTRRRKTRSPVSACRAVRDLPSSIGNRTCRRRQLMSLKRCPLRGPESGGYRLETMLKKLRASGQIFGSGEVRSVRHLVSENRSPDKRRAGLRRGLFSRCGIGELGDGAARDLPEVETCHAAVGRETPAVLSKSSRRHRVITRCRQTVRRPRTMPRSLKLRTLGCCMGKSLKRFLFENRGTASQSDAGRFLYISSHNCFPQKFHKGESGKWNIQRNSKTALSLGF